MPSTEHPPEDALDPHDLSQSARHPRDLFPAFVEQFLGTIRAAPCGTSGSNYTDARYAIDRAVPVIGSTSTPAVISTSTDSLPVSTLCITATNLAELSAGTHLLPVGTTVYVFGVINHAGLRQYVFNQPPAGSCAVQITGAASGGGKYNGTILTGSSSAVASGTLSMPEGLGGGAGCLILNEEEDGQTGHRLASSCYAVGQIVGSSNGTLVVAIRGALGSTSGPTSISGSGTSSDSTTWSRSSNGTPVSVTLQTRTVWDSTGGVLYGYQRTLTFDARGLLTSVSAETQVTIDTPTACT
jgi:hypothetical protein